MTQTTIPTDDFDSFDYDKAGQEGQTLADPNPGAGASGGDKYAALAGVGAATGEPTGPAKCNGPFSEARIIAKEGVTYVAIKLTVASCDRPEVSLGGEHELFGPVVGGDGAKRTRHLKDLKTLAGRAGAKWDPSSLAASLAALDAVARTGKQVAFSLKPGSKGGTFVNL